MMRITDVISLDESELVEEFIRASGPGGQNVNKVATAVQLRFDARNSPSLPDDVRVRLIRLAGKRVNADGVLSIEASSYRTQEQNRADARVRLIELIQRATVMPKTRRKTKPSLAAKQKRLDSKKRRASIKSMRRAVDE